MNPSLGNTRRVSGRDTSEFIIEAQHGFNPGSVSGLGRVEVANVHLLAVDTNSGTPLGLVWTPVDAGVA
ncbi:hypothetical protein D3C72_2092870 [compost metagenome]